MTTLILNPAVPLPPKLKGLFEPDELPMAWQSPRVALQGQPFSAVDCWRPGGIHPALAYHHLGGNGAALAGENFCLVVHVAPRLKPVGRSLFFTMANMSGAIFNNDSPV